MKNYQEFPKMMRHPQSQPAVLAKWDYAQKDPSKQALGSPARFPNVMVNNADQEGEYAAKGYLPSGVSDPEAYRRAMTNNEERPASTFVEFPKYVYRMKDGVLEDRLVENKAAEEALPGDWFETPGKAASAEVPEKDDVEDAPPTTQPKRSRKKAAVV